MRRDPPAPLHDGIYRTILWALVATVVAGVLTAVVGDTLYRNPAIGRLGSITALIGGALYAFFRYFGARESQRRSKDDEASED